MAKININFNNKDYSVDEQSLSAATNALKSHLSTTMSGSGATINLGGIIYNVDSAKLSTATNDFVAHLGTIAGNGKKVTINGVEYSVDSNKVAGAVAEFESVLDSLVPEVLALAPGLYRTGAIALYEEGDYEAASAMLETSWDDLEANGVIAISEGVELPDDLVMNEYGFYFGVPYSITIEGMTAKLTFNEDGSAILNQSGEIMELPAGSAIYGDHSIDMTSTMGAVFAVSPDGTSLEGGGMVFSIEILDLPEMNEYGFYFGVFYSTTMEGVTIGFTFNEDGSAIFSTPEGPMEIPAGTIIYEDHSIDMSALDMPVLAVSPDGTMIDLDGMILSVGSSSVPPKGVVYLPNRSIIEGDLVLPNDGRTTGIPIHTFVGQASLTGIIIPDSVTSIGWAAFYGCTSLVNINIPNNVTSIGVETFRNCSNLTSVNIPEGVTNIGDRTFYSCSSLISVNIPDSVTNIGEEAFEDCSNLTSVNIPDGVTSIGRYAFYDCSRLTSITIPDSVTSIGGGFAFEKCSSLTSITIGNNVTSIGIHTFSGCNNLNEITFNGTIAQWNTITFGDKWNYNVPATYVQCSDGQVAL